MEYIIFSIALLAVFNIKWVIFLVTLIPIRIVNIYLVAKEEKIILGKEQEKPSSYSLFIKKGIKQNIISLINGYMRYHIFQLGFIPSHRIRNFIYKYIYLIDMKSNVVIYFGAEIRAPYKLHIGDGSIIGDKSVLGARRGGIWIGDNVNLGSFVNLWTGQHDYNDPYFRSMPHKRGPIKIEDRVWIGPNVTILHSVTVGEGAVVAAGSVVTKNVEPYTLVGGIPAKKIGVRSRDLKYKFSGDHLPFY